MIKSVKLLSIFSILGIISCGINSSNEMTNISTDEICYAKPDYCVSCDYAEMLLKSTENPSMLWCYNGNIPSPFIEDGCDVMICEKSIDKRVDGWIYADNDFNGLRAWCSPKITKEPLPCLTDADCNGFRPSDDSCWYSKCIDFGSDMACGLSFANIGDKCETSLGIGYCKEMIPGVQKSLYCEIVQ